ncbi:MAG: FtsX-like permease family protein, partial [Acidobacteria bacterium]|nr:FtsX-like permease family protein [Acidobacteriota bacterium]
EFGVRMALGASRQTVLRMVVREGLALVAVGLVIGGVAALGVTRVLATYLFDTRPTDPFTFTVVGIAFAAAGLCACLGPAWRATTVDPMAALRVE